MAEEYKTSIKGRNITVKTNKSDDKYVSSVQCPFCDRNFNSRKENTSTGARYNVLNNLRSHAKRDHE